MANSRYPRVNPKSGLKENWDDHFKIPSVTQRSITSLRFNGQTTAVHTVPLENGLSLDFYARLGASDELVVTFHGAYRKDKYQYPRFERVQSLEGSFPAHIAFADPTLRLDRSQKMLLSWYLGGPGWDPMDDILKVIARAKGRSGAKHVVFIGGFRRRPHRDATVRARAGFARLRPSPCDGHPSLFPEREEELLLDGVARVGPGEASGRFP